MLVVLNTDGCIFVLQSVCLVLSTIWVLVVPKILPCPMRPTVSSTGSSPSVVSFLTPLHSITPVLARIFVRASLGLWLYSWSYVASDINDTPTLLLLLLYQVSFQAVSAIVRLIKSTRIPSRRSLSLTIISLIVGFHLSAWSQSHALHWFPRLCPLRRWSLVVCVKSP